MRLVVMALVVIVASLGLPRSVRTACADPLSKPASAAARSHLALGNKLYNIRSFEEAVAEYKVGALIEAAPVFDYNLGQCFRQLRKYEDAIWHYERFLSRSSPEGKLLEAVNSFLAQMKSELDEKARTMKPTEPAPAQTVQPVPLRLHDQPQVDTPVDPWYADAVGWGLAGTGAVGLGTATGFLINAASLNNDANASSSEQEHARLKDKGHTRTLIGSAIGVGGAGLLVAGIIKLAVHPTGSRSIASWNISASGDGVMVFGQF